jgi:hypothetical protein
MAIISGRIYLGDVLVSSGYPTSISPLEEFNANQAAFNVDLSKTSGHFPLIFSDNGTLGTILLHSASLSF